MKHKISIFFALVAGGVIFYWPAGWDSKLIWWGLVAAAWIISTVYGVYTISANWFLKSVNSIEGNAVALTFDDGPDPSTTPAILSVLREGNVPATFFLIGEKAEKYPELVLAIQKEGHSIGNHTWSHSYSSGLFSVARLREDIEKCSRTLESITGKRIFLFRPPFGVTNPRYARVLNKSDMISVGWSLRSFDTVAKDSGKLLKRLKRKIRKGQIVLLHDSVPATVEALPLLIAHCRSQKIEFARVRGVG